MASEGPPPIALFRFEITPSQSKATNWYLRPRMERLPLMHYIRADYFCSILESDSLHLSPSIRAAMDTEDALLPPEGRSTPTALEPLGNYPATTVEHSMSDLGHNMFDRPYSYQQCWTCSVQEDVWMWTVYGHAAEGVCILSDSFSLASAIHLDPKLELDVVGTPYWTQGHDIPRFIPSVGVAVKRAGGFEAENEVRVTATIRPDCRQVAPPPFVLIKIDPAKMIQGLILGPRMKDEDKEAVLIALSLRCPEVKAAASSLEIP